MKIDVEFRQNGQGFDVDLETEAAKTVDVGFGETQTVTVEPEQEYDPTSERPQSGKAVAEAIAGVEQQIPLVLPYTFEWGDTEKVAVGADNTVKAKHFNRTPKVGDIFLVNLYETLTDKHYHVSAQVTKFSETSEGIIYFKLIEVFEYPTVDQEYSPESDNAQSGQAVSEAIELAKEYTDAEVQKLLEDYPPEDGKDGVSPTVAVSQISNGHKVVITDASGQKSFDVMNGKDGQDGKDGVVGRDGVDGENGKTPYIQGGYWFIDGVSTGVKAAGTDGTNGKDGKDGTPGKDGQDGTDGHTPYIQGGFWFINGVSMGVKATGTDGKDGTNGKDGVDGKTPYIQNGYWYINGTNTGVKAEGVDGTDGKDGNDGQPGQPGKDGVDGKDGETGAPGERGTGILKVTTAPTSYTTATAGINPIKRMSISTIKSQADVNKVLVGDCVCYSYYLYHIYYLDSTYAYMDTYQSIRGATGAPGANGLDGYTPVKGVDYWTPTDIAEIDSHTEQKVSPLSEGLDKLGGDMQDMSETFDAVIGAMLGEDYDGENVPPSIREIAQDVVNNEGIAEIRQTAEQAAQDAGTALGDINTLYNVDLAWVWEAIDTKCSNEEANQQFSNAVKGYVEGKSVALTDISPIQHGVRVWNKANPDSPVIVYVSENKFDSSTTTAVQYANVEAGDDFVRVTPTNFDGGVTCMLFTFTAQTSGTYHFSCDFSHTGTVTSNRPNEILFYQNDVLLAVIKLTNGESRTVSLKNITAGSVIKARFYPTTVGGAVISTDYVATLSNIFIGEGAMEVEVEEGGTVSSLYPGMAIIAKDTSTTLCVEYNRDINKALDSVASGGDNNPTVDVSVPSSELIEIIDITEATSAIVREQQPDGTPYKFKSIMAMLSIEELGTYWVKSSSYFDKPLYGAVPYIDGNTPPVTQIDGWRSFTASTGLSVAVNCPIHIGTIDINGVVIHMAAYANSNPGSHGDLNRHELGAVYYNVNDSKVTKFELTHQTGFPAGTKIFLFGVR